MKCSVWFRWVWLLCLSVAMLLPVAAVAQQEDAGQLRARSNAWILEQRSRKGYRVADLTDTSPIRANDARINNSGQLVKNAGQWSRFDPPGYSPAQIRHAYGFDEVRSTGKGQIIAIVDAFDYPNAAADMKTFIKTFGLKGM